MVHAPGGCGKSHIVVKIADELATRKLCLVSTCPTGAGAVHMRKGRTFASALRTHIKDDLGPQQVAEMRTLFNMDVAVVVVDEVSMLSAENLTLLDRRLRQLYDPSKVFGGVSVLLVGDFLQLRVIGGADLYKIMYVARNAVEVSDQDLFRRFRVFEMTTLIRAHGCADHQQRLRAFRLLPAVYPSGARWSKRDIDNYHPMTDAFLNAVTTSISAEDIANDPGWNENGTILTTSNTDRAALNICGVLQYGKRLNRLVVRWRKPPRTPLPDAPQTLIYDESTYPQLFGYFVYDAPAQLLSNSSGNVDFGAANGTGCRMISLAWDDEQKNETATQLIDTATLNNDAVVTVPFPPKFLNVALLNSKGELLDGHDWPDDNNLETRTLIDAEGNTFRRTVTIPIGLMNEKSDKLHVKLGEGKRSMKLAYRQHAVELAFAITVWKSQGGTYPNLLMLLEGFDGCAKVVL